MQKYHNLVLDFNNIFWRVMITSLEKTITCGEHIIYSHSIENFFDRVKDLKNKFGYDDSIIYFLCDNPESHINIRKVISEGQYKHSREFKNLPKDVYKTMNIVIDIIKCFSNDFRVVQNECLEADDLTYPIAQYIQPNKNSKCLFISADLDWARNIEDNCDWYNFHTIYNSIKFKAKYKFSPKGKTIQLWKALKGDNSDCISNAIPYLPEEILLHILNNFNDVDDLYANLWDQDYVEKWKVKLKEVEVNVRMNYQLTDFILVEEPIENYTIICKENIKKLEFWFNVFSIDIKHKSLEKENIPKTFFGRKKYKRI